MSFQLQLTRGLAAWSFNPLVLAEIEKDALALADIRLLTLCPGEQLTVQELIREANNILPQANHPDAISHFFATQHQIQDEKFDNMRDLGRFITSRTFEIESRPTESPGGSTAAAQWLSVLSDLAECYSYVIEAAENLQEHGLVAARRLSELQSITSRPDDNTELAKAQFFDKAMVFYTARNGGDKMAVTEQFR